MLDGWLYGLFAVFIMWDINKDSLGFVLLHFEGVAFSGGKYHEIFGELVGR